MPIDDLDLAIAALLRLRALRDAGHSTSDSPPPATPATPTPSPREVEVLSLIQQGKSRVDVARALGLHPSRVAQLIAALRARGINVPGGARRGAALRSLAKLKAQYEDAQKSYRAACDWLDDEDREKARRRAQIAKAAYERAHAVVLGTVTDTPAKG
jgi:biotin operon repressor